MAPKKEPPPPKVCPEFWWLLTTLMAAAGCVCVIISLIDYKWRVAPEASFHFSHLGQYETKTIAASQYGLYMVNYGSGVAQRSWGQHAAAMCSYTDALAPGSMIMEIFGSWCPGPCIAHLRSRCAVYRKFKSLGIAGLIIYILVILFALLGVGWYFIFGSASQFIVYAWMLSGIAGITMTGVWVGMTASAFDSLVNTSQFPYPAQALAVYLAWAGAGAIILAGLVLILLNYIEERNQWKKRQEEIQQMVAEEGAMDPYAMGYGPPMGPPAGGGYGPPPGYGMPPPTGMPPTGMPPPGMPPGMRGGY
eukprot:GHVU01122268.1.p1 GENE.GHVU01122268.1~~GHVU01122268.1.p1  ORF type:complete len:306 (-),score=53.61 GHVU01122268.1:1055-1972(-)